MKKYCTLAFGMSVVFFMTYGAYGLAFWYGSRLINDGLCTPGSVFTVSARSRLLGSHLHF
jgi:ABC transporter transmembrane region